MKNIVLLIACLFVIASQLYDSSAAVIGPDGVEDKDFNKRYDFVNLS